MISENTIPRMMHFNANHLEKKKREMINLNFWNTFASRRKSTLWCKVSCTWGLCTIHAGWANFFLHTLKIWMSWKQFSLIAEEEEEALRNCVFLQYIQVYIESCSWSNWSTSSEFSFTKIPSSTF